MLPFKRRNQRNTGMETISSLLKELECDIHSGYDDKKKAKEKLKEDISRLGNLSFDLNFLMFEIIHDKRNAVCCFESRSETWCRITLETVVY